MSKTKKSAYYWLPPLITLVILIVTFVVKGVFPFGNSNISYYDMSQQYIPMYARNQEILHGNDSLIFSWLSGAGTDMSSAFSGYSVNPFSWITFFVGSEHILNFMTFFFMIKVLLGSFTIALYTRKNYDLPLFIHTALCLMYTLSGYVVQYYTNIFFLDSFIILPLMILALRYLYKNKNPIPFILTVIIQFITGAYLGIMTMMFVVFYAFGLMLQLNDANERKRFASRLGIYTFTGIAISGICFLTPIMKWTQTTRTSIASNTSLANILSSGQNEFFSHKAFMIFNTGLALAFLIIATISCIVKKRKPPKEFLFRAYIFVLMLMPILFEGTLLVWHMGSYVHFPFRNGFMLTFAALELAAYQYVNSKELISLETKKAGEKQANMRRRIITVLTALFTAASIFFLIKYDLKFTRYGIHMVSGSVPMASLAYFLSVAAYIGIILIGVKRIKEVFIFALITVNAAATSICFIAPKETNQIDDYTYYATRDRVITDAVALKESSYFDNDSISRVKMLNPSLGTNYAFTLGVPSIAQWTNEVSSEYFLEICQLGYNYAYTGNSDSGGTAFSDALLNNKKVISYSDAPVSDKLYSNGEKINDFTVYDCNFSLPFGILTDRDITEIDSPDMPSLSHHEQIYEALSSNEKELIRFVESEADTITPGENKDYKYTYKINLHLDNPSVVYYSSVNESQIYVNGEIVKFPYYDDIENTIYPKYMLPGIMNLGTFDSGDIEIKINTNDDRNTMFDEQKMSVGVLDLETLRKFCSEYENSAVTSYEVGKNTLKMTADVNGNNYLFLPLEYLEGWSAEVNGQPAEIIPVLSNAFMAIKLPDGHCDISMKYFPKNVKLGLLLSAAGITAAVILLLLKKFGKDLTEFKIVQNTAYICFGGLSILLLIITNINPIIGRIVVIYQTFCMSFINK